MIQEMMQNEGSSVRDGLTKDQIKQFPIVKYQKKGLDIDSCPICLEDLV